MKKLFASISIFLISVLFISSTPIPLNNNSDDIEKKIDELISKMTLDEKIGQLVQNVGMDSTEEYLIREGRIGSVLIGTKYGVSRINRLQRIAVEETRLGIPLLFANDIIHGYHTIFPIPLAETSSWNPELVKEACSIAAFESAAEGTNWTYAPMVDITRDPRWGRIMEGSGEDPYLGSVFASARVKGFQGNNLSVKTKIGACAKHYVAYGGAEGGRDYNTVDISERTLREVYLPPFHSAVNSDVLSIMSAFNDLNGIPASVNHFTLTEILRNEWHWDGVVICDFDAIGQTVYHRFSKNKKEAAYNALTAGVDIDMVGNQVDGNVYAPYLKSLVEDGRISWELINKSVRNVLRMKFRLGLFENPYTDVSFFQKNSLTKEYKDSIALQLSKESIVLLKNENNILPLNKEIKKIALIGPLADNNEDIMGGWAGAYERENVVTVLQGLKNLLNSDTKINFVKGCNINDSDYANFNAAISAAKNSDVVIMVVGEDRSMSGEASSKTNLDFPEIQEKLVKQIYATGKPIVVVLMNGRPLTINWISENIPVVVEAWYLGNQAGNAIAQVLFGDYNPSGKLTVTFPRSTGQIPIYYYQKSTGRPFKEDDKFTSKYLDSPNTPLYPFGYGLSYTSFEYQNIRITKDQIKKDESVKVSIDVSNNGKYLGEEVVQLYIRDEFASITRPVKELKGFQKVKLNPGETKTVKFDIIPGMLSFLDINMRPIIEPGKFIVMIGGNSVDLKSISFDVIE